MTYTQLHTAKRHQVKCFELVSVSYETHHHKVYRHRHQ